MELKQFKDDLIILKKFSINENDLLINAFGRFSGKIQLKAKGGKKILSKFTGRLEPLSIIQAEIYNSGKAFTLTNANLKLSSAIGTNLANFNLSQRICYLLNKLLPFEEPNPQLFNLTQKAAESVLSNNLPNKIEIYFLTKFLDLAGHLPSFLFCHECHKKFDSNPYLDSGYLVCSNCLDYTKISQYKETDLNTIKLLNFINCSNRIDSLRSIKIPQKNHQEANAILEGLINFLHA